MESSEHDDRQRGELRKLDAELNKLALESREIERRLNSRWWEGHRLPQYFLAVAVTSTLLFGWFRSYIEPIREKQDELNKIVAATNVAERALVDANAKIANQEKEDALKEKIYYEGESRKSKKLTESILAETQILKREGAILQERIVVLNREFQKSATIFPILNKRDPINRLQDYGWTLWSDNYFGNIGYYIVMTHPNVRSGNRILLTRIFEIENAKQELGENWNVYLERILQRVGPIMALDISYLGLFQNKDFTVGGTIYASEGRIIEFAAPLSRWSDELSKLNLE